jgi:hypothetical protein
MRLATATILVCLAQTNHGIAEPTLIQGYGAGASCATWTSSKLHESTGSAWLTGFWSGANYFGPKKQAGQTTDVNGIVALAKRECAADPSAKLAVVAMRLYERFLQEGR